MLEYLPYIWIAVILFAIGAEAATSSLVSIWFMPAALICLFMSFLKVPVWIQVLSFFALSAVMLLFFKFVFKRFMKKEIIKTNAEALIGKVGMVVVTVDNLRQLGVVRIDGKEWTARSADDSKVLLEGEIVMVERIEGVKLICR